ncbi:MAG: SMC family ATPase [Candidatus Caldatribacteriota bacterium]|nr:SMC family ATPase [Candidatus Caldatribacteriota bacterium]
MIPIKLTLKNFLSYGEDVPPLDFEQFDVACLSGNNGQGKSALLDALTWAVWGEGRKSSREKKADSSLLRIGQKDMQVEFIFDLEGDRYRIIRTFSLAKKNSRSGLEFQVFNRKTDKYVSLSCSSIRKTQEEIIKTLRIDYQTFINSAFILQGRIDEFSQKSARERKEILSEILVLSRYDELADLAKFHLKEINNSIMTKESRLEYIYQEMTNLDFYKEKIKELSESYKGISRKIKTEEIKTSKLKEDISILKNKGEQCAELESRMEQQRQEIVREQKQITLRKKEITNYEKIILQKEKVLANFKNYQKFNTENNKFSQKLQKIRKIEEKKILTGRKIESERVDLEVKVRNKQDRYKDLKMKAEQGIKNSAKVSEFEKKMKGIRLLEKQSEEIRKKGSELGVEINNIKSQIERLEKGNKDNQEKLYLLRENPEGECPLCEAKLNAERKRKIEDSINKEISSYRKDIKKLKKEAEKSSKQKDKLAEKWKEAKQGLRDKDILQQNLSKAYFECKESTQAEKLVVDLQEEIKKLEKTIQEKGYALEEQKRLKEFEEQIKNIGYDEARHHQINSEIEKLGNAPLEKVKLEEAEKKINSLREELSELKENYQRRELNIKDLEKKKDKMKVESKGLPLLKEKLIEITRLLDNDQILKEKILGERGGYQSKLDQCLKLEKEKKVIGKELEKGRKEQNIYEKLIVAFGKNGIQALIIENVLPEIEEEANNLLAKLTNNGTQISIESLRDLKSGGIKETLDIKISDELGIRDYEMYSGGESFRIDFAIRIALSKLLTRRAGTKLRTLVMDEGFGTQDEEGIDNLVQAIQSIRDDFDKILVITHLESLKNSFPVRIEVTKLPEVGSRYEIIKN